MAQFHQNSPARLAAVINQHQRFVSGNPPGAHNNNNNINNRNAVNVNNLTNNNNNSSRSLTSHFDQYTRADNRRKSSYFIDDILELTVTTTPSSPLIRSSAIIKHQNANGNTGGSLSETPISGRLMNCPDNNNANKVNIQTTIPTTANTEPIDYDDDEDDDSLASVEDDCSEIIDVIHD